MKQDRKVLNDDIRARTVKLITDSGENLGEMSISEARNMASEAGLDLLELSNDGNVSVVKMLDYGKHLYKQKKNEQKQKQKSKTPDLKVLRITFAMGEHDMNVRKKQIENFAKDGNPVKLSLMLRGRENHHPELGFDKMHQFIDMVKELYKLDKDIKKMGNTIVANLLPIKN